MELDAYDLRILDILQQDARTSLAEIGRRIHLSQPSVAERVRRLEEAGVIQGYAARVDPAKLGYSIQAFIRVSKHQHRPVERWAAEQPEVLQCHTITGDDCAVLRVVARDVRHLESLIVRLNDYGKTSTSIVLSSSIDGRALRSADAVAPDPAQDEAYG
jgi:Lrp/AsnC family leucine-responsive transcriptional regulator